MSLCEKNIDCLECQARGMCNSYALFKYQQGTAEAIDKIRGFIKAEGNPYGKPRISQKECVRIIRYLDALKEQNK